ncbi:MAG TPA: hypothetical protein VHW02_13105 [Rhizomicrobium sp.]|jgi:hypothetical protein|nr:hypothetical protein [Rhizomicrobium sp.]
MSELDLLNLGRAITATETGLFTQIVTISFAMIIAIYYFLHQAKMPMKVFAFVAYAAGMFLFYFEMLLETNVKFVLMDSLAALTTKSAVTQEYIGIARSWVGVTTALLLTGSFWILLIGNFFLLFFWKKDRAG